MVIPICYCLPTPLTLASGGESDLPSCGPPASFSGQQCRHSGRVCPQFQGLQRGTYMGAVGDIVGVTKGIVVMYVIGH